MTIYEVKLKKKLDLIRKDLKYYQQMTAEEYINGKVLFSASAFQCKPLFGK